jgi:peptidyl-prolyl isomerase F (cyclophilin D)
MSENFIALCTGVRGYGYKGCKFFRCKPDDHVVCGDFEHNNGSGGYSAMKDRLFLAEQCPLKDHKGAVRMRGIERTAEGRCRVGSQFMAWVGDIEYKEYKYTLVFGEVTQGLQHLQEISRIGMMYSSSDQWLLREEVIVTNCGLL